MDTKLFITFIILNIVNVIVQTVKSLVTVKCGKGLAALVNALAYGLYTVVVVLMVCELPLWLKVVVIGSCNLVGVYIVKWLEEKARKDKLWLVKITIPCDSFEKTKSELIGVPFTYFNVGKYFVFDCFCDTKEDTEKVIKICKKYNGKSFATENKLY